MGTAGPESAANAKAIGKNGTMTHAYESMFTGSVEI